MNSGQRYLFYYLAFIMDVFHAAHGERKTYFLSWINISLNIADDLILKPERIFVKIKNILMYGLDLTW